MTFLHGFFLVNFPPFGLIVLAGILLFFLRNDKSAKWYYPLLFIVIILVVISFWRIPVLIDRRYAMPTLVPGIILSVFVIMLLPGILKHFNVKYATAIVRTMIVILLAACSAKAMREQKHKPYLQEIPKALQKNCDKSNVKKVLVLVFGNPGGHLVFEDTIKVIDIPPGFYLLENALDLKILKNQYQHIYLLCVEHITENFCVAWEEKYIDKPELVYEYVNKKQIAYRLYCIKSPDELHK
ncbi:MAG: hypothetical protein WCI51_15720 [Lentisphaerota bacterium]